MMNKKKHCFILVTSLSLALVLGGVDDETHSIRDLFFNNGNIIAIIVYTLLFMAVAYTGVWMYIRVKLFLKKKPSN
jgi:hypothetical protein